MTPDTEEVFHGELLTPDFIEWMNVCDLHMAFDKLTRVYGRSRALELWDEIGLGIVQKVRDIITEWNFGPVPDRAALDAIFHIVGDNYQPVAKENGDEPR